MDSGPAPRGASRNDDDVEKSVILQNAVYPPSITKQSAVWYDDALLIRYTAMPPKSLGSPKRRIGIRGITAATNLSSASTRAVMSLLIQPGRIAFEVTP